jgi:HK97 family phage major capsid protein
MSDDIIKKASEAVESLNKGFEEFKKANDLRLSEIEKKGAADPLLDEKIARIEGDLQKAQKIADEAVLAVKRQSRVVTDEKGEKVDLDQKALVWAKAASSLLNRPVVGEYNAEQAAFYAKTHEKYIRFGKESLDSTEIKALSVGGDPDGGYVVYPDMNGRIVQKVFETSPMRAYASIQVISSDALEGIYDLDEADSGWVGETESRTETGTPQIGRWRIPVHEIYAAPKATQKILDDASINMESWLAGHVSAKFAREESAAFVSGNGINKPRGFLTYAAGTTNPGTIERFKTGVSSAFAANPGGLDKVIDALYALKAPYRANASFFMTRAVTALARKLKDQDGQYQWQPSNQAGQPATLLGYPVAAFEDMEALAAGSLSMAVADMREAYQIVDRIGIRTLRDPYTTKGMVTFYTTKRVGGDVVNFEAIKLIEFGN